MADDADYKDEREERSGEEGGDEVSCSDIKRFSSLLEDEADVGVCRKRSQP